MISMSEYYIIIGKHEIGENVEKLLSIYRQCGNKMKLLLLPFMMCIELFLLFAVFIIGIIRPSLGLDLCDWFSAHLPSRDWYWKLKMDVSPCRLPNPERLPGGTTNAVTSPQPSSAAPVGRVVGQVKL